MNVLLADDHEIVRTGLKQLLESHHKIDKVFEASDGKQALKIIESEVLELVVLDISMPKVSGLEVLKNTIEQGKSVKFLILSIYPEKEYAIRSFKLGASGYITKDSAADELHQAINTVLNGKHYVSRNLQDILFDVQNKKQPLSKHESLSDREFRVFILLAQGKKIKEIADKLFISNKTVSTYKSRIFNKMKMKSVQELTKYAYQNKLIE